MHSVLYRVTKRVIENSIKNGQSADGMDTKLDVFYAAGKLTDEEYTELTTMLKGSSSASESAAESTEETSGEAAAETETTEEA